MNGLAVLRAEPPVPFAPARSGGSVIVLIDLAADAAPLGLELKPPRGCVHVAAMSPS